MDEKKLKELQDESMPYTAQERAHALEYALALMRDRLTVEAPLNAARIQRHIDALIELVATAPPMDDSE